MSASQISTNKQGGRPVKLTPELRARLVELLALGLTAKRACAALRVSFQTLSNHRKADPAFDEEIDAAVAASIERSLKRILRAAESGDVSCDRWLLERRFPEEFGRHRVELTGPDGGALAGSIQIILPAKDGTAVPAGEPVKQLEETSGEEHP